MSRLGNVNRAWTHLKFPRCFSKFDSPPPQRSAPPALTPKGEMSLPIKNFVFFDVETTGLPQYEHNTTKITELCMIMVQADHIELGVFPRVLNKLHLCFNPLKLIGEVATNITGLSNDLLENQPMFTADTVSIINNFLNMNRKPVCLVAHNGNRFDFPILRAEIVNVNSFLTENVYCLDSIIAFRDLENDSQNVMMKEEANPIPLEFDDGYDELLSEACDNLEAKLEAKHSKEFEKDVITDMQKINETTPKKPTSLAAHEQLKREAREIGNPGSSRQNLFDKSDDSAPKLSYKLETVFQRITKREPTRQHEAEGDVMMLLTCAATLAEKFVHYANKNARKFEDIPIMRPGVPIGS